MSGSATEFPKTKEQYVNWGDMEDDGERGSRFRGEPLEPPPHQALGLGVAALSFLWQAWRGPV